MKTTLKRLLVDVLGKHGYESHIFLLVALEKRFEGQSLGLMSPGFRTFTFTILI